ncbi:hypothetical protein [Asaccharospora irregularis]|uniref:Uncharacterized protein n=1 Tax=Asaccharospora irregularis DSM 2635 TaxID=1121321 RepID=A0A1M5LIC8_9FIRM|nr:hypothetical protein [Asaccharospora irregularis]SHG64123.1 hypothetical protein SAMN04488530_104126 [Asaccharospora irregularis DSM 2635]
MFQIMNVLCLLCVCALTVDIMIYFCKDVINVFNQSVGGKSSNLKNRGNNLRKKKIHATQYSYENKIAR